MSRSLAAATLIYFKGETEAACVKPNAARPALGLLRPMRAIAIAACPALFLSAVCVYTCPKLDPPPDCWKKRRELAFGIEFHLQDAAGNAESGEIQNLLFDKAFDII